MRTQKILFTVGMFLVVLALTILPSKWICAGANAAQADWPKSLGIYGPPSGTTATIAAIEVANIITKYVRVSATGIGTSGMVEACNAMLAGKTPMSIISNLDVVGAMEHREGYQPGGAATIRNIMTVYEGVFMILTQADSGIKKFTDMKGRKSKCRQPGAPNATQETFLRALLWGYNMTFEDFRATPRLSWDDQAYALTERSTDVIMRPMQYPVGIVQKLARTVPLYYVPIDKNKEINEKFPEALALKVPAGTYDFIKEDVPTLGFQCVLAVRSDVPESLVYEITKAIYSNLDEIKGSHPLWRQASLEYGLSNPNAPYHAGVVRYYKEIGKWTEENEKIQKKVLTILGQSK